MEEEIFIIRAKRFLSFDLDRWLSMTVDSRNQIPAAIAYSMNGLRLKIVETLSVKIFLVLSYTFVNKSVHLMYKGLFISVQIMNKTLLRCTINIGENMVIYYYISKLSGFIKIRFLIFMANALRS